MTDITKITEQLKRIVDMQGEPNDNFSLDGVTVITTDSDEFDEYSRLYKTVVSHENEHYLVIYTLDNKYKELGLISSVYRVEPAQVTVTKYDRVDGDNLVRR